jgi:hypothetical protein
MGIAAAQLRLPDYGVDIRPFRVDVPDATLQELRRRINATEWPERETVADQSQGVHPGGRQRVSRRALSSAAQLGRAGIPQAHLLQPAPDRRPLRRLGATRAPQLRATRLLSLIEGLARRSVRPMTVVIVALVRLIVHDFDIAP